MENVQLNSTSAYANQCIVLATKHAKSLAIAPVFWNKLGISMIEYSIDTDKFGTFTGEIERIGTPLECAQKKCQTALKKLKGKVDLILASEGSFGPHPLLPFIPCSSELLYFIDNIHGFHLHVNNTTEKTNFASTIVESEEGMYQFAQKALFPSHALILKPNDPKNDLIFKGIDNEEDLIYAFELCLKNSSDKKVSIETDMRANFNPTRMNTISELAAILADRLNQLCPKCNTPGWGKDKVESGLPCVSCGSKTELTRFEIFCCPKCKYQEQVTPKNSLRFASPEFCYHCNP